MQRLKSLLCLRLLSEKKTALLCQGVIYALSLLIFVLGVLRLTTLGLTEGQLFFAVLMLACIPLLGVTAGTSIEILYRLKTRQQ